MSSAARGAPPEGCKRGKIKGLSRQAAARHAEFLQSVVEDELTGFGYAPTFTLRSCPESQKRWAYLKGRLVRYLKDRGDVIRYHWTVEQAQKKRGGVPHVHLAVYFDHPLTALDIWEMKEAWVRIGKKYGARHAGQFVAAIRPGNGWSKYVAKHSARTQRHYQNEGLPAGWDTSGRLWGRWGDWPVRMGKWLLNSAASIQLRRLMRSWLVTDARQSACKIARHREEELKRGKRVGWCARCGTRYVHRHAGVGAARRVLVSDPGLWSIRGMRGWIPEDVMVKLLEWVAGLPGCVVGEIVGQRDCCKIETDQARARHRLGIDVSPTLFDRARRHQQGHWDVKVIGPPARPPGEWTARRARIAELRQRLGLVGAGGVSVEELVDGLPADA